MLNSRPNREDILRRCVARLKSDAFFSVDPWFLCSAHELLSWIALPLELAATGSGSQIYRAMTLLLYWQL